MLTSMNHLPGFTIGATDRDTGRTDAFYFDDTSVTVRHLVIDTGGWLTGRRVLISPMALPVIDWDGKRFNAALTKSPVEQSPDIDADQSVSRQQEINDHRNASEDSVSAAAPIAEGARNTASFDVRLLPRLAEADDPNLPCAGLSRAR